MNLLADENIDKPLVDGLRLDGHNVLHVLEMEPGITDAEVLQRAYEHSSLLLTQDKDFGELVYRQNLAHNGVILLRLDGLSTDFAIAIVSAALAKRGDAMTNGFTVISPGQVRVRRHA